MVAAKDVLATDLRPPPLQAAPHRIAQVMLNMTFQGFSLQLTVVCCEDGRACSPARRPGLSQRSRLHVQGAALDNCRDGAWVCAGRQPPSQPCAAVQWAWCSAGCSADAGHAKRRKTPWSPRNSQPTHTAAFADSITCSSAMQTLRRTLRCGSAATSASAATGRSLTSVTCGAPFRAVVRPLYLESGVCPGLVMYVCTLSLLVLRRAKCVHMHLSCRYGDHAPAGMEAALRGANVVIVIVTADFLRGRYCLEELQWACDEAQRRRRHPQPGQEPAGPFPLIPIFYHDQDHIIGLGVDSMQRNTLQKLLRQHHAAASAANRAAWLDALLVLAKKTGLRQDSTGRCGAQQLARLKATHCILGPVLLKYFDAMMCISVLSWCQT